MTDCVVLEKSLRICTDKAVENGMGSTQKTEEPHGGQNLEDFYLLYHRRLYSTRLHLRYDLLLQNH